MHEFIGERIGTVPIIEKIVESHLGWFRHVWRRSVETLVRRVD